MIDKIFVFGASITQSAWWTWKDFLEIESGITVINLSVRGAGNTYMVNSLVDQPIDANSLVVGMFTNIDKFDWYVEGDTFQQLSTEKHPPIAVDSNAGFWCTGSWFPGQKQLYEKTFYSLDYFAAQTIQQICALRHLCAKKQCRLEIFYDSPIWSYTEQDLNAMSNTKCRLDPRDILSLPLTKKWAPLLDDFDIDIDSSSLIGFCWEHHLEWGNSFYKGHPPSSSHMRFYREVMCPRLQSYLSLDPLRNLDRQIAEMDKIWHNNCIIDS
jgi:hypothetical protein